VASLWYVRLLGPAPRSLPSEPDPADANHGHSRTIEFQPHHVQLAQVESQGAAGTLVVVRLTLAGRRLRPLKEPEPGSGLRAPAPRAREGARRHGDHPRPGGILRRAPDRTWSTRRTGCRAVPRSTAWSMMMLGSGLRGSLGLIGRTSAPSLSSRGHVGATRAEKWPSTSPSDDLSKTG